MQRLRRVWLSLLVLTACSPAREASTPLTVFAAGSLARPIRAALDTIAATGGPVVQLEIMGSREMIRAVTNLGRTPDLLVTADADEMERLLVPAYAERPLTFARNRVVLALSRRSRFADSVTVTNWARVVADGRMRIARADPARAPLGYRTQLVWRLAELQLDAPGLADAMGRSSPASLMRGNESDLATLLESGDADAAWCYESLAKAMSLRYVTLGDSVDLGSAGSALRYASARVTVPGDRPGDSVVVVGSPIRYAMAVLTNSTDAMAATVLRERLLDARSRRIMQRYGLDAFEVVSPAAQDLGKRPAP